MTHVAMTLKLVAAGAALVLGPATVNAGIELDRIVAGLPGSYHTTPVLETADDISVTMMYPRSPIDASRPGGAGPGIQYLLATYSDGGQAIEDFERILSSGLSGDYSWQVIVQTRLEIHWVSGQCRVTAQQFRSVYAEVVAQIENDGRPVEGAILCRCGAPCQRILVDR